MQNIANCMATYDCTDILLLCIVQCLLKYALTAFSDIYKSVRSLIVLNENIPQLVTQAIYSLSQNVLCTF
ncbi:hypothetical protein XENTR_v10011890 [Xenopus tropicalis]|nr:hypothetical protein XENTR_v10011890 [Xenopus tropicalis]